MIQLILASESPRRKILLTEAGFNFSILPVKVSEIPDKNLNIDQQIIEIARSKAIACPEQHNLSKSQEFLILSADTMVIFNNQTLGKPKDEREAKEFLDLLSGKIHEVKTALCLYHWPSKSELSQIETSRVHFKNISENEKYAYIASGEPFDKAGGYGIQGHATTFVEKVEGNIDNVIGLPVGLFKKMLTLSNYKI